jgi:hypothetical protein
MDNKGFRVTNEVHSTRMIPRPRPFDKVSSNLPGCGYFRLLFAYAGIVFNLPQARKCDFTIRCKGCDENIPAPVDTMPDDWIIAQCPLCGSRRRYLPADIFRGTISHRLINWPPASGVRSWAK